MTDKYIIKATGEREIFDPQKLKNSLSRAGASLELIEKILDHISLELKDDMTTKEIYEHAFEILKSEKTPRVVARYSLRNAIMDLGPSGFPFEKFIAEIFRAKGFEVTTEFSAQGECANHEIDVTAWNENKLVMIEAKFHNELGLKSDLKTVLYVKARWDDIKNQDFEGFGKAKRKLDQGILITNTKFSQSAINYASCRGMSLVGWNHPQDGSLQDLIEETLVYPITCLKSIGRGDKQLLLDSGIILCKQIKENKDVVSGVIKDKEKARKIIEEIDLEF